MKVYAVYSIPKSPDYKLEGLFATKELAKKFIKENKTEIEKSLFSPFVNNFYDIQIEEVHE